MRRAEHLSTIVEEASALVLAGVGGQTHFEFDPRALQVLPGRIQILQAVANEYLTVTWRRNLLLGAPQAPDSREAGSHAH
jgi:hypothetical protein